MHETYIEERKRIEAEFHDKLRDPALRENAQEFARLTSNRKWYSITTKSKKFVDDYLRRHSPGARALDFACGDGQLSFLMAEYGAAVTGIDISAISVANAASEAAARNLRIDFQAMDCEQTTFPDHSFDLINVSGVLHHMDLTRAYRELARVLKPGGSVLCVEAIGHNPVFHTYRKLTPHLRTQFEAAHILKRKDVLMARRYFERVETHFFYLASVAAVPFRNSLFFRPALATLETVDSVLLGTPLLRWWAWQVAFVLSGPKNGTQEMQ